MAGGFSNLTFVVEPVVLNSGTVSAPVLALNTGIVAGTSVVAAIVDPISDQRVFNPIAEGNAVANSAAAATWLPVVKSITAVTVTDYLNQNQGFGSANSGAGVANIGQIRLILTPAAANVVEASSYMEYWLSPQALVILATSATTF